MKNYLITIFFISIGFNGWTKDTLQVASPSGNILVKVWMGKQVQYKVLYDNNVIVNPSRIDFLLDKNRSLSSGNAIKSSSVRKVREQIISPVPEKRKVIPDVYNVLL